MKFIVVITIIIIIIYYYHYMAIKGEGHAKIKIL